MGSMAKDPLAAHEILIDTREQRPLQFAPTIRTVRRTLQTGDYSIIGHEQEFTVERKSIPDLIGTVTHGRARFERELQRMAGYAFRRVIVEGCYRDTIAHISQACARYKRQVRVNAILGTIYAFEVRYGVPFVFAAGGPAEAAERVMQWMRYWVRECETRRGGCLPDDLQCPPRQPITIADIYPSPPSPYVVD